MQLLDQVHVLRRYGITMILLIPDPRRQLFSFKSRFLCLHSVAVSVVVVNGFG